MPRKPSTTLTEAELRLMRILWERGSSTVSEVVEHLPRSVDLAYNTVQTILGILETKGYVRHTKRGRAFVYRTRVGRADARRRALKELVSRFFDGSPEELVLDLVQNEDLDEHELERIRRQIDGLES